MLTHSDAPQQVQKDIHAPGRQIDRELEKDGIIVRSASRKTLAEEMPAAYKDIDEVIRVVHETGISKKVAAVARRGLTRRGLFWTTSCSLDHGLQVQDRRPSEGGVEPPPMKSAERRTHSRRSLAAWVNLISRDSAFCLEL